MMVLLLYILLTRSGSISSMPWGGSTDGGNGDDDETNIVEETVRVSCLTEGILVSMPLV